MHPIRVTDSTSNAPEHIDHAARTIRRSTQATCVFNAIYTGKRRVKTVAQIARATRLSRKQVLTQGKRLLDSALVEQLRENGDTAYRKIDFFHRNKRKILSLAKDARKLASFPTKRSRVESRHKTVQIRTERAKVRRVSIDDIDSFRRVKRVSSTTLIGDDLSETRFKKGVQSIIGEPGKFLDWGGERNDLFTTRMMLDGRRVACSFGFKGPGMRGRLVPGKMGKNGDQIQRLFETDADVFLVQYCREIDQSVLTQMQMIAMGKSALIGKRLFYGIIDGVDSRRLTLAYASRFGLDR